MSDALKPLIAKAAEGPLTRAEAESAFDIIMEGDATAAQTGGFLMALRTRGEVVDATEMPRFEEPEDTFSDAMEPALTDVGLLGLFSLLCFAGAFVAFLRYDVR